MVARNTRRSADDTTWDVGLMRLDVVDTACKKDIQSILCSTSGSGETWGSRGFKANAIRGVSRMGIILIFLAKVGI